MSWFKKDPQFDFYEPVDQEELALAYRRVFSGPDGEMVLIHLLSALHFFRELENDEDRVLHNAALRILRYAGVWQEGQSDSIVNATKSGTFFKDLLKIRRKHGGTQFDH